MLPSTAINRFDLSVASSQFNLMMNMRKFVGHRVFPGITVAMFAANFLKINIESLLTKVEDTERKPKSGYKRDDWEWTQDSYQTAEHGVEELVDDELIARYGSIIRAEAVANMRGINRILQAYENACATAAQSTANLPDGAGSNWSATAGTPITDITNAMDTVEDACGRRPNCLVIPAKDLRNAVRTSQVLDQIKYDGNTEMTKVEAKAAAIIAEMCSLEDVIVANGKKNTADKGQTASLGNFWTGGSATLFCRSNDGMNGDLESIEPQFGRTIIWEGGESGEQMIDGEGLPLITEEYREESRRGGTLRVRTRYQIKTLHSQTAYVLTGLRG